MSQQFDFKVNEKPDHYTRSEWDEINFLMQKAKDKFVNIWLIRQAMPYLLKEKIDITDLEHVLDFFNSESPEKPPRLGRVSYLEAVRQANRWTDLENKRAKRKLEFKEDPSDTQFVFQYGQDRWVKLLTANAYKREGVNMNHCVGNGTYANSIIYSLRDEDNEPHCTIEVASGKVKQIKGKKNTLVVFKYHKSLFAFLAHLGIQIDSFDLERYGFIICKEGNFDANSLPDEVEVLNSRRLSLGVDSRIPKKLKAVEVEVETRKDLDLSKWEVTTIKVVSKNNKIKLPKTCKNISLENCKVQDKIFKGDHLSLVDSSIVAESIDFKNSTLKNSTIHANDVDFIKVVFDLKQDRSKIFCKKISMYELSVKNEEESSAFHKIIADEVIIQHSLELYYDKENQKYLENQLKKVSLGDKAKLVIHNPLGVSVKVLWEKMFQLDINGPMNSINLESVKELYSFKNQSKQEISWILGLKHKESDKFVNIMPIVLNQDHSYVEEEHYFKLRQPNV